MSKIEPGCLAMIKRLDSPNYGKIVTVVELYDGRPGANGICFYAVPRFSGSLWIVAAGNLVYRGGPDIGKYAPWVVAGESSLRRIDNPPDSAADLLLAPLPKQDKVPA